MDRQFEIMKGPFKPIEGLQGSECPAWFRDARRINDKQIASVHVSGRPLEFAQKDGALLVVLPDGLDRTMPVCIKAAF